MTDRLPHEKGFHISWDQIHRDSRALTWRLDGKGPDDGQWRAVVGRWWICRRITGINA